MSRSWTAVAAGLVVACTTAVAEAQPPRQPPRQVSPSQSRPRVLPGVGQPAGPSFPGQPGGPSVVPGQGMPAYPSNPSPGYPSQPSSPSQSSYPPQSGGSYVVPGQGTPAFPPTAPTSWRLGIYFTELPSQGLRIDSVFANGAADRMGLEQGDIIMQVNGQPIRSSFDFYQAMAASGGYARILALDNRLNPPYQRVEGYLDP